MGDVSNWILTLSSFITRDIRRVSLVVLLLRSATWLIFHTHSHTHKIQNAFLILWQILSNSFVLHDRQHCSGKLLSDITRQEETGVQPNNNFCAGIVSYVEAGLVQFRTAL